jgi:alginate O-acetyltransferase complex protein AlgI
MLFNSLSFAVFFAVFYAAYRAAPPRARQPLLLGASLLFYALWIPIYLLQLLAVIGANWLLLRAILRGPRPRAALAASLVLTLGLLAFFKYANFSVAALAPLLGALFGRAPELGAILLPLGISFYSFNVLALAIDAARGQLARLPSLSHYALFVTFFPHSIAGPILRGPEFLPQLEQGAAFSRERSRRGLWLLASGVAKKVVLGDFLLAPFVQDVFADPGVAGAPAHLLALYGFAFQIYFDFSGYTDMARGLACLLGYELPVNFLEPYLSRSPAEFWRRWHITLSRWLRDYLYIPLGGNRHGGGRTAANLLATMLLGGLWHGAGWNFLLWGGAHGALLVLHRFSGGRAPQQLPPLAWRDAPKIFVTFHAVCLPWVFFRAKDVDDAFAFFGGLFGGTLLETWPVLPSSVIALCAVLHLGERWARTRVWRLRERLGAGPAGALVEGLAFGALAALAVASSGTGAEFIYFQF